MSKDQKKDILNYESQYGKDLHKKDLMEDARKKEIKKYEKDHEKQFHERKDSKEKINIYVDNLNIDNSTDNSNYGNNIAPSGQCNLDLKMDWSIKSSEPLYNNNGLQLPKSNNNIKEEEIKNSKTYKDMENNYKEALNKLKEKDEEINQYQEKIIKLEYMYKEKEEKVNDLMKVKKSLIKFINHFKGKIITEAVVDTVKILIDNKKEDGGIDG